VEEQAVSRADVPLLLPILAVLAMLMRAMTLANLLMRVVVPLLRIQFAASDTFPFNILLMYKKAQI